MTVETIPPDTTPAFKTNDWRKVVAAYQQSDVRQSIWQIINSVIPYIVVWYLAYLSLEVSYILTLALALLAALFAMRVFIIFHDCGHGSFFKSQKANNFVGVITGIITFTPYYAWRHSHAVHHATSGDLDRRGVGDIWTLTFEEYQELPTSQKIAYRLYRNPLMIFFVGPVIEFVVLQRLPMFNAAEKPRERNSVWWTNLALLIIVGIASLTIGLKAYILVQLPIIAMAASYGVWLFYVQHQYENVYWERHEEWDYASAALHGSSFYKLPKILQWFSGNIGFHHIHHLSPRIPNYNLEACHYENEMFREIEPLTIRESLKAFRIRLWDEDRHKMIGYHKPDEDLVEDSAESFSAPQRRPDHQTGS